MRIMPVSVVEPQIHLLTAGLLECLYRPAGGIFADVAPGDLLWVREPFFLPASCDGISPSQARDRGAAPVFVSETARAAFARPFAMNLPGRRRFARELPRAWHRQHIVVTTVARRRVHDLGASEIAAQGYVMLAAFAQAWDSNLSLSKSALSWNENPEAIEIRFEHVSAPIPPEILVTRTPGPSRPTAARPKVAGVTQSLGLAPPPTAPGIASGRDPCPRCGTRGDIGCAHQRPHEAAI